MSEPNSYGKVIVTMEVEYRIPVYHNNKKGEGITYNEWTVKELVENWFSKFDINRYHASRDASEVGGSKRIVNVRIEK